MNIPKNNDSLVKFSFFAVLCIGFFFVGCSSEQYDSTGKGPLDFKGYRVANDQSFPNGDCDDHSFVCMVKRIITFNAPNGIPWGRMQTAEISTASETFIQRLSFDASNQTLDYKVLLAGRGDIEQPEKLLFTYGNVAVVEQEIAWYPEFDEYEIFSQKVKVSIQHGPSGVMFLLPSEEKAKQMRDDEVLPVTTDAMWNKKYPEGIPEKFFEFTLVDKDKVILLHPANAGVCLGTQNGVFNDVSLVIKNPKTRRECTEFMINESARTILELVSQAQDLVFSPIMLIK